MRKKAVFICVASLGFVTLTYAAPGDNVKAALDGVDSGSASVTITNNALPATLQPGVSTPKVIQVTAGNQPATRTLLYPTVAKPVTHHKKRIKKKPQPEESRLSSLIGKTFDFQYIGNITGSLWALKEYDPRLNILDSLGSKKQITVNIDLTNSSIQDVIDTLNQQANGNAKIVFDPVSDTIRLYFNTKTDYGVDATEESKKWREGGNVRPVLGKDGVVLIPYGEQQAQVVCQPLQLCDISFEPGEYMTSNPIIGDDTRWTVYDAVSQDNGKSVQHLIVKPHEAGLDTSLMVPTNKRTYMVRLRSSTTGYVSRISFYYPKEFNITQQQKIQSQKNSDAVSGIKLNPQAGIENLDFNYKIEGDSDIKWKPIRAFSDGSHTYIQMPADLHSKDAPTFNVLGPDGETPEIVNWDLVNNTYIIDKIFSKAEMIMGNSDDTIERVVITHTQPKKSWW